MRVCAYRISHIAKYKGATGIQSECRLQNNEQGDVTMPGTTTAFTLSLTHARLTDTHGCAAI